MTLGPPRLRPQWMAASTSSTFRALRQGDAEIVRRRIHPRAQLHSGERKVLALLLHLHEAQPAVVEDDDGHRQVAPAGHGQLSHGHLEAAVPHHAGHRAVRVDHLGGIGGGHAETHGRPAVGGQHGARQIRAPLAGDLVGVGAHVIGQDAIRRQGRAQGVEHVMRREPVPFRAELPVQPVPVDFPLLRGPVVGDRRQVLPPPQGLIEITATVEDEADAWVRLRGRGAHVEYRGLPHPFLVVDLNGVVADGHDQVGLVEDPLDVGAAGPADDSEPVGMALRQEALGMKGGDERHAVVLDEAQQRIRGSGPGEGQSGHHQRPPAAGQRRCKGRPGFFRHVL